MGKISLKKETKGLKLKPKPKLKLKPKPKPKSNPKPAVEQRQNQSIVVNVGSNEVKSKQRRTSGPIQKKAINKQQTPTTIHVPQSLPITQPPKESMNELINYLKQAEQHKEAIKEREVKKSNELEKEKKEEKRSEVLTRDEVQDNFSVVYPSSNISSLKNGTITSGKLTSEPNIFSNLSSLTTSGASTPSLLSRPVNHNSLFEALSREADLRSENPNSGKVSFSSFNSNISIDSFSSPLSTTPSTTSLISEPKKQTLDEVLKNTVVTSAEDPVIEQVLEEMPENQIVIYGPERAGQTATATAQVVNPIDNSISPPLPFRFNKPLPTIRISDIIAENAKPLSLTQISEKERMRDARLKALEPKKPLLTIEPDIPNYSEEELNQYKEQTQKATKQKTQELINFELKLDNMTNRQLGQLLKDNNLKGTSGYDYTITKQGQIRDGSKAVAKDQLKKNLSFAFENGYLKNV